ncbi:hypothetical protein KR093_005833, partial [Drosophila rubida]
LEEMDNDRLNELESILYATIHYSDATSEEPQYQQHHVKALDMDTQSMPPPSSQQQQQQVNRFVSGNRVINNVTTKSRYWTDNRGDTANISGKEPKSNEMTAVEDEPKTEQPKRMPPPAAITVNTSQKVSKANNSKKHHTKSLSSVQQLLQNQQQLKKKQLQQASSKRQQRQQIQQQLQQQNQQKIKQHQQQVKLQQQPQKPPRPQTTSKPNNDDEPERFDQRLLVAIPPNWPKSKCETPQHALGPFGKANRKLEQLQKLEQKRQKSKQARNNKKLKQSKERPVEMIDLVESETSSNADDVVIVPLPPVPIIDVDASDEEEQEAKEDSAQPYLEENAMDAADVKLGINCTVEPGALSSALTSPCNSVLSSDDFIVQKDTSRLLADHARATDEDLLVLTENAMRNAAEPDSQTEDREQVLDNSSEYEFVPPSKLEEIKQNFRVDEQQFRALDVYESESDLTESGIYCKAKQKSTPTIIRSVDSDSDTTDVEAVVDDNVVKTKRLRKRRASSTKDTQSDPNNELDALHDETDSENDVEATGVPGIARGMAVERCKRKIRRISSRPCSESAVSGETRQLVAVDGSSESGADEEALPTAREIAERLLKQEQRKQTPAMGALENVAMESEGSDANTEQEAEMNDALTADMSTVFESIDTTAELSQHNQQQMESSHQEAVSTTEAQSKEQAEEEEQDVAVDEMDTLELEAVSEDDEEAEMKEPEVPLEHNMSELTEELSGSDLVGWNDEMCRFYNDSWNGEQFNMNKLLKAMSGQRYEWRISNADRFPVMRKRSNLKCTNCFEMGHMRAKCPRPRKPIVCYTCGMTGHAEPRCPNAICLGCGAKQALYVQKCNKCSFLSRMLCQLCKMRGHTTDSCPDKWRRYHSTVSAIKLFTLASIHLYSLLQTRSNVALESKVQYRTKHCSNCAARGHLFEECRQRIGEYRNNNNTSMIMSHQKVYKDRTEPLSYLSDASTFFALDTPFHFNWSTEFSKNSCYARFLKVANLARPQKKIPTAALQQVQPHANDYVPNPLVRAALNKAPPSTATVISNEVAAPKNVPVEAIASPVQESQEPVCIIDTQSEQAAAKATTTPSKPAISKPSVTPHDLDSDSNYSFSEHFEVPSSTTATNEAETVESPAATRTPAGPMDNLPEIIPLSSATDNNEDNEQLNSKSNPITQGISMCVTSKATSTCTSTAAEPESLPDVPSEAKILMAQDQTQYLFSPEGCQFLTSSAKKCNVSVRMDFKEYGYVLVIYGLKKDQENLQLMLLHRNQEVKRRSADFQRQKPPKRIDVLIRFLRDGINSLSGDLGNAKSHYIRIKELEDMNTKNGFKLAERKRRLLNMILFGQAGLGNGSMHLDQLLAILKRLLERSPEENATPAMRNEIEEHYSVIFSAQPNDNYEALLQFYAKLENKNRLRSLNIEPAVLGLSPRKASATPARRLSSPPPPPPVWPQDEAPTLPPQQQQQAVNKQNRVAKPRALFNNKSSDQEQAVVPAPPKWPEADSAATAPAHQQQQQQPQQQQHNRAAKPRQQQQQQQQQRQLPPPPIWQHEEQQHNNNNNNSNSSKMRAAKQRAQPPYARPAAQQQPATQLQLPCNNMQQRAAGTGGLHLQRQHQPLQSECVRLLAGMEGNSSSRNSINTDASKPSMFWSRESLRYLDELFRTTVNRETLERLHRVLDRSRRGQLSHNDYRAVIRLHSLMGP